MASGAFNASHRPDGRPTPTHGPHPSSAPGGAVRQQRARGGRQRRPTVRYSEAEYAAVEARAAAARKSVPCYIVEASLADPSPPMRVPAELIAELGAIRRHVAAIGNNVNQMARRANAGADVPADQMAAVGDAAAGMRERLDAALSWLTSPGGPR